MKKFTKISLLISMVCICAGAVCLGAGIVLGSGIKEVWAMVENGEFNIGALHIGRWYVPYFIGDDGSEDLEIKEGAVKESFAADDIKNLEIDIKYGSVKLTDSKTEQIEITVDAPERNVYQCGLDGQTLMLLDQTSGHIWKGGLGRGNDVEVVIAIPKGKEFQEAELITNAGSLDISHHLSAFEIAVELDAGSLTANEITSNGEFTVDIGAGNLKIDKFAAELLDIECGMGRAELYGKVYRSADIECGMGEIELNLAGKEDDFNYDVSCGLGAIKINGKIYSTLSADKEIDNNAGKEVSLDCGMGEITLSIEEE